MLKMPKEWWKSYGIPKWDCADVGTRPHGHRYSKMIGNQWNNQKLEHNPFKMEIIKQGRKYLSVWRRKCVYDGCGVYQEKPATRKVCQHCGQYMPKSEKSTPPKA